eukprot:scaffold3570_cov227-Amphora_coffeaeformis.AAC.5
MVAAVSTAGPSETVLTAAGQELQILAILWTGGRQGMIVPSVAIKAVGTVVVDVADLWYQNGGQSFIKMQPCGVQGNGLNVVVMNVQAVVPNVPQCHFGMGRQYGLTCFVGIPIGIGGDPSQQHGPIQQDGPRDAIQQVMQDVTGAVGTPIRSNQIATLGSNVVRVGLQGRVSVGGGMEDDDEEEEEDESVCSLSPLAVVVLLSLLLVGVVVTFFLTAVLVVTVPAWVEEAEYDDSNESHERVLNKSSTIKTRMPTVPRERRQLSFVMMMMMMMV